MFAIDAAVWDGVAARSPARRPRWTRVAVSVWVSGVSIRGLAVTVLDSGLSEAEHEGAFVSAGSAGLSAPRDESVAVEAEQGGTSGRASCHLTGFGPRFLGGEY